MAEQTNPFGDLTKMLEQFKVPGVDMSALVESRKKDHENAERLYKKTKTG